MYLSALMSYVFICSPFLLQNSLSARKNGFLDQKCCPLRKSNFIFSITKVLSSRWECCLVFSLSFEENCYVLGDRRKVIDFIQVLKRDFYHLGVLAELSTFGAPFIFRLALSAIDAKMFKEIPKSTEFKDDSQWSRPDRLSNFPLSL